MANIIVPARRGVVIPIVTSTTARAYDMRSMLFGRLAAPDPAAVNGDKVMLRIRAITGDVFYYFADDNTVTLDKTAAIAENAAVTLLGTFADKIPAGTYEDVTIDRSVDKYFHVQASAAGVVILRASSMKG